LAALLISSMFTWENKNRNLLYEGMHLVPEEHLEKLLF